MDSNELVPRIHHRLIALDRQIRESKALAQRIRESARLSRDLNQQTKSQVAEIIERLRDSRMRTDESEA